MSARWKRWIKGLIPARIVRSLAYKPGSEHITSSYSQEGEDLLLERIFEGQESGFYVDIGAFRPFKFSNTMKLYERGWTGICIEPNPEAKVLFQHFRPNDHFVNKGISKSRGELTYYMYDLAPLNTFSKETVEKLTQHSPRDQIKVETSSLKIILDEYLPAGLKIDLFSIDVEGMDLEVLESNDWSRYRPAWIICEVHLDKIEELLDSEIHRYLAQQGYELRSKLFRSIFYAQKNEVKEK